MWSLGLLSTSLLLFPTLTTPLAVINLDCPDEKQAVSDCYRIHQINTQTACLSCMGLSVPEVLPRSCSAIKDAICPTFLNNCTQLCGFSNGTCSDEVNAWMDCTVIRTVTNCTVGCSPLSINGTMDDGNGTNVISTGTSSVDVMMPGLSTIMLSAIGSIFVAAVATL